MHGISALRCTGSWGFHAICVVNCEALESSDGGQLGASLCVVQPCRDLGSFKLRQPATLRLEAVVAKGLPRLALGCCAAGVEVAPLPLPPVTS